MIFIGTLQQKIHVIILLLKIANLVTNIYLLENPRICCSILHFLVITTEEVERNDCKKNPQLIASSR